jgi:hypothetical protein
LGLAQFSGECKGRFVTKLSQNCALSGLGSNSRASCPTARPAREALPVAGSGLKVIADQSRGKADFSALAANLVRDDAAIMPGGSRFWIMFATAIPNPAKATYGEITGLPISTTKP